MRAERGNDKVHWLGISFWGRVLCILILQLPENMLTIAVLEILMT